MCLGAQLELADGPSPVLPQWSTIDADIVLMQESIVGIGIFPKSSRSERVSHIWMRTGFPSVLVFQSGRSRLHCSSTYVVLTRIVYSTTNELSRIGT